MSDRPRKAGWVMVKFGDVVCQVKDKVDPELSGLERYVAGEHMVTDDLHIRRWGIIGDNYLGPAFHMRFKPRQILYGSRRTYLRKVAVADFEGICANTTYVLESEDPLVLLPEYLPFVMQTEAFHEHSIKQSKGSVNPYINFSDIAWYEFPLPPLAEQRRIASLLWAVDEMITSHIRVVKELTKCKKAYLSHIFQKGLAHTKFTETGLENLSLHWNILNVGDICEFLDNMRIPLSSAERAKRQGQYPYYGASGIIDYIDAYIFNEPLILLGEDGANIVDRSTPLAFKVSGKIWVNNHAHVLRVGQGFDIDYIVEYLEYISYEKYKTGTAQPKLNKENVSRIPIPVLPKAEQESISGNIKLFNTTLGSAYSYIKINKALKDALLSTLISSNFAS